MSLADPHNHIIESYEKYFPMYKPSRIYILDGDIYTSHYVNGDIMYVKILSFSYLTNILIRYGFYFNVKSEEYVEANIIVNGIQLVVCNVGHNLNSKYEKFVGISLDSVEGVENAHNSMQNAGIFHKRYVYSEIVKKYGDMTNLKKDIIKEIANLYTEYGNENGNENGNGNAGEVKEEDVVIHEYPILAFVPLMCYCCT